MNQQFHKKRQSLTVTDKQAGVGKMSFKVLPFNPNKAGLFEGSFFWVGGGGVNLLPLPFIFPEEFI